MADLRPLKETLALRKSILKREIEKFKITWYLDSLFEKFVFLYGAISLIATFIYLGYLFIR